MRRTGKAKMPPTTVLTSATIPTTGAVSASGNGKKDFWKIQEIRNGNR